MPRYCYIAKSGPHQTISSEIDAESEADAINTLNRMGYFLVSLALKDMAKETRGVFDTHRIPRKVIVLFTLQLSSLLESGVNIVNSLSIISRQAAHKYFRSMLEDVIAGIKEGKPLSESLESHPRAFTALYTSIIHSGEVGGTLELTLKRLAEYLEKEDEFRNSIRAALTYPIFVLFVGCLTVMVLLGFVIPRLVSMFEDMGQALPLPTQILIFLSEALRSYWWLLIAGATAFFFLMRRFLARQEGRLFWDTIKLRLPLAGDIALKSEISRLARTLSLLLSSGITIVYALDIVASITGNSALKNKIQQAKEAVSRGVSLSSCLKEAGLFPSFVTDIVSVGEEAGSLEKSLTRIADNYEKEVDRSLKELSRLLEPVIILITGLIVGFIVLSMLLPIFQLNLLVQ